MVQVTCFECNNDRAKIDDRSLNSPINRFRFRLRFSALEDSMENKGLGVVKGGGGNLIVLSLVTS